MNPRLISLFAVMVALLVPSIRADSAAPLVKVGNYSMIHGRYGAAVVSDGDFIYIIGGAERDNFFGDIERFDVRTHQVTRLTDKLIRRRYHGAALLDGKIYIVGGQSEDPEFGQSAFPPSTVFAPVESPAPSSNNNLRPVQPIFVPPPTVAVLQRPEPRVEIYDLKTGAITFGEKQRQPRLQAAVAQFGTKLVVSGGTVRDWEHRYGPAYSTDIYDLRTGRWTQGAPTPNGRNPAAATVGNMMLTAGGQGLGHDRMRDVNLYLLGENSWRKMPDLCAPASGHAAVVLDRYLLLMGNSANGKDLIAYDLLARTSFTFRADFKAVRQPSAIAVGDHVYVFGGIAPNEDVEDYIQDFRLVRDTVATADRR